jgi:signal transduction histidine kinase
MRAAERAHIATELHDTLIQDLAAMSLQAEVADDQLPTEPDAAKTTLDGSRKRLQEVVRKGRAGMTELRFGVAAANDLAEALARTARELQETCKSEFHLVIQGHPRPLHPLVGHEVCLIAREALFNSFRHAGATRIDVEVSFTDDELRTHRRHAQDLEPLTERHGGCPRGARHDSFSTGGDRDGTTRERATQLRP